MRLGVGVAVRGWGWGWGSGCGARLLEHVLEDVLLALRLVLRLAHLLHACAVAHVARLESVEGVVVLAELLLVRGHALLELGLVGLLRLRLGVRLRLRIRV